MQTPPIGDITGGQFCRGGEPSCPATAESPGTPPDPARPMRQAQRAAKNNEGLAKSTDTRYAVCYLYTEPRIPTRRAFTRVVTKEGSMRWIAAVFVCGLLAMVVAFSAPSLPSWAMQPTPAGPSDLAKTFCPEDATPVLAGTPWAIDGRIATTDPVIFVPTSQPAGEVEVPGIVNPYPASPTPGEASPSPGAASPSPGAASPTPDSGTLVLREVTLPERRCIVGSYFSPAMIMMLKEGRLSVLIEPWPGLATTPEAVIVHNGEGFSDDFPIGTPAPVNAGDWLRINHESTVGFSNARLSDEEDVPAVFYVAGLKAPNDPGGGGGHTGRQP